MKAYANALFLTAVLFLIAVCTAMAQAPAHPDPTAVYLGTFTTTVTISSSSQQARNSSRFGAASASAAEGECQIKTNVSVWRLGNGQIDYIIDAASVEFTGDCDGVDLSASDVFALLAQSALADGIQLNYSPCPPGCQDPGTSRVYSALCVRTVGNGPRPYVPCDMTSLCYREFSYCCPEGTSAPDITEVPRTAGECGAGMPGACETTCGGSGGPLLMN